MTLSHGPRWARWRKNGQARVLCARESLRGVHFPANQWITNKTTQPNVNKRSQMQPNMPFVADLSGEGTALITARLEVDVSWVGYNEIEGLKVSSAPAVGRRENVVSGCRQYRRSRIRSALLRVFRR